MSATEQKEDLFLDEAMKTVESLPTDFIRMIKTMENLTTKTNTSIKELTKTYGLIGKEFVVKDTSNANNNDMSNCNGNSNSQSTQNKSKNDSKNSNTNNDDSDSERTLSAEDIGSQSTTNRKNNNSNSKNNNDNNTNKSPNMTKNKTRQNRKKKRRKYSKKKKHETRPGDLENLQLFEDLQKYEESILSLTDEKVAVLDQSINSIDCMMQRLKKQANKFESTFKPNTIALSTPSNYYDANNIGNGIGVIDGLNNGYQDEYDDYIEY